MNAPAGSEAEFAALTTEAKLDAAAPATAPGEPAKPAASSADEWLDALKLTRGAATIAIPKLADVYTDEALETLAAAVAAVADKYGLTVGGAWARFAPEIQLAMVALPLAKRTMEVLREAKREKAAAAAPATPAGDAAAAKPKPTGSLKANT